MSLDKNEVFKLYHDSGLRDGETRWPKKTYCLALLLNLYDSQNLNPKVFSEVSKNNHAELQMITKLKAHLHTIEEGNDTFSLQVYLNYAPCNVCASSLVELVDIYPNVKVDIKAAAPYHENKKGLEKLLKQPKSKLELKPFNESNWKHLRIILQSLPIISGELDTNWSYTPHMSRRDQETAAKFRSIQQFIVPTYVQTQIPDAMPVRKRRADDPFGDKQLKVPRVSVDSEIETNPDDT